MFRLFLRLSRPVQLTVRFHPFLLLVTVKQLLADVTVKTQLRCLPTAALVTVRKMGALHDNVRKLCFAVLQTTSGDSVSISYWRQGLSSAASFSLTGVCRCHPPFVRACLLAKGQLLQVPGPRLCGYADRLLLSNVDDPLRDDVPEDGDEDDVHDDGDDEGDDDGDAHGETAVRQKKVPRFAFLLDSPRFFYIFLQFQMSEKSSDNMVRISTCSHTVCQHKI